MTRLTCARLAALFALLPCTPLLADPGDFGAMPGLWKITTHPATGQPATQWQCVDEGADPWATFAAWTSEAAGHCSAGEQHRASTSLAWNLTCDGHAVPARVAFDSARHYTGSVAAAGGTITVEGERLAACTSPTD
jgi:hypothetical protein